jgi:hypothetical protein
LSTQNRPADPRHCPVRADRGRPLGALGTHALAAHCNSIFFLKGQIEILRPCHSVI